MSARTFQVPVCELCQGARQHSRPFDKPIPCVCTEGPGLPAMEIADPPVDPLSLGRINYETIHPADPRSFADLSYQDRESYEMGALEVGHMFHLRQQARGQWGSAGPSKEWIIDHADELIELLRPTREFQVEIEDAIQAANDARRTHEYHQAEGYECR